MTISKALIMSTDGKDKFTVMFNPAEYAVQLNSGWNDNQQGGRPLQNTGTMAGSLRLDLFFDTSMQGTDVRVSSGKLQAMLQQDVTNASPRTYKFAWGTFEYEGYMELGEQKYTLFMENGTPLRVRMTVTLRKRTQDLSTTTSTEAAQADQQVAASQGEPLPALAQSYYNDPASWRPIAAASGIDDPLARVLAGTVSVPVRS